MWLRYRVWRRGLLCRSMCGVSGVPGVVSVNSRTAGVKREVAMVRKAGAKAVVARGAILVARRSILDKVWEEVGMGRLRCMRYLRRMKA